MAAMLPEMPRWPFIRAALEGAPEDPGVYLLYRDDELIYIGRADGGSLNLRSCLLGHLGRPCTGQATHYAWEMVSRPAVREAQLLGEYRDAHRALPRCNAA